MCCDQHMGLPPEAVEFLKENEKEAVCVCCTQPLPKELRKIGSFTGMFESEYPLHRHILKDGRFADEFLQDAPLSSGPCFFIGLKVGQCNGYIDQIFEWLQSDIDHA